MPAHETSTLSLHYTVFAKESHEASPNLKDGKIDSFNGRNFKVVFASAVNTGRERIGAIFAISLAHSLCKRSLY